jgi:hypothetical protein
VLDLVSSDYRIWRQDRGALGQQDPLPGPALAAGKWGSIDGGHRLIPIGSKQVLDWTVSSGQYRVWNYAGTYGLYNSDPLPGAPLWQGQHAQLKAGNEVVELDNDHLLTWDTKTGKYQVWQMSMSTPAGGDLLGNAPITQGTFDITGEHRLINLNGMRVLDFNPVSDTKGTARVFNYQLGASGAFLNTPPVTQHDWSTIAKGHQLVALGGSRILDWVPDTGGFRVWTYDPSTSGTADPLPGMPVSSGQWGSIDKNCVLIKIDSGHVIGWVHDAAFYRVWRDNPAATGDFLPFPPLTEGFWQTIGQGHRMIALTGAKVLEWDQATGNYRIWKFAPPTPELS